MATGQVRVSSVMHLVVQDMLDEIALLLAAVTHLNPTIIYVEVMGIEPREDRKFRDSLWFWATAGA